MWGQVRYWYEVLFPTILHLFMSLQGQTKLPFPGRLGHIPYQERDCFCSFAIDVFFCTILAQNLWLREKRDWQPRSTSGECSSLTDTIDHSTRVCSVLHYILEWTIHSTVWCNRSSCLNLHLKNYYYDENTQLESLYKQLINKMK